MSDLSQFRSEIVKSSLVTVSRTITDYMLPSFGGTDFGQANNTDPTDSEYNLLSSLECTLTNVKNNTVYISGTFDIDYAWSGYIILSCYRNTVDISSYSTTNLVGRTGNLLTDGVRQTISFSFVDDNAGTDPTYYWSHQKDNGNVSRIYSANTLVEYKHGSYLDLT